MFGGSTGAECTPSERLGSAPPARPRSGAASNVNSRAVELVNGTKMAAGWTLATDPDGRERVVVVVKGTFGLPTPDAPDAPLELSPEQHPLVMADEFTGEPGLSATVYESDFPPHKPRCDVLVNGSAHAPGGRPATSVVATLRVSAPGGTGFEKSIEVVGARVWEKKMLGATPSAPEPFVSTPITYDVAFGGTDASEKNPDKQKCHLANPVGTGYYPHQGGKALDGLALPHTQQPGKAVISPTGKYKPMSFGPIGRSFAPRYKRAGTYDDAWQEERFPHLPDDFDPAYHQSAPDDQLIDHPTRPDGTTTPVRIELVSMTPEGRLAFELPTMGVPVEFTDGEYERTQTHATLDTIIVEPDLGRVMLAWRTTRPLDRDIFDVRQCVVGRMSRAWYRARLTGKTYYPSIADLAASPPPLAEDLSGETAEDLAGEPA